jgi:DNA polymerase V
VEIWGIATRLTKRLNALGIHSILDLSRADPVMIRDRFSIVMMRTVLEVQGTACIPMEEERIERDQLIFSRSFAKPITTSAGIRQILSVYGQQASARLAKHGLQAKVLTAFAGTSHFNPKDTSYPSACVPLPMPTADRVILTKAAHALLPLINEGIRYARAPRRTQTGMQLLEIALSLIHPSIGTTGVSIPWLCGFWLKFLVVHLHAVRRP